MGWERSKATTRELPPEPSFIGWLLAGGVAAVVGVLLFNRTVRYDWLGQHLFLSLSELQDYATRWQWFYNHERQNMALNGFTPMQHIQRMT